MEFEKPAATSNALTRYCEGLSHPAPHPAESLASLKRS